MNVEITTLGVRGCEPCWSPDGRVIAYSDHRYYSLGFVKTDGTKPRYVPNFSGESPQWFPVGGKVLVRFGYSIQEVIQSDLSWKLVYGSLVGESHNDLLIDEFALSPDGQTLAILHEDSSLVVWDLVRGTIIQHERDLGSKYEVRCLSWSPDGQWIAFEARHKDSRKISVMAYHPKQKELIELVPGGFQPEWSPRDTRIAFLIAGDHPVNSIEIIDFKSRHVGSFSVRSSSIRCYPRALSWSPDGCFIAFQRTEHSPIHRAKDQLAVLHLRDRRVFALFEGRQEGVTTPSWSPDGTRLATSLVPEFQLHVIDIRS